MNHYEVWERHLAIYVEKMEPNEVKELEIDIIADVPGTYTSPPSYSYLYYHEEHKYYNNGPKLEILPQEEATQ